MASRRIKYLGVNSTKEVQDLDTKLQNIVKIINDLNKLKDIPYLWIGRYNIVKMAVLSKLICRFNAIPVEIPPSFFSRNG